MRMEQLEYLVDIAQTGSISNTAHRLFTSQQVISRNIKQLEDELGVEILFRTNTGVHVTSAGQKVVAFAQTMLEQRKSLSKELQSVQLEKETVILHKICSTSAIANFVIPKIINDLDKSPEKHKFKIFMENSLDDVVAKVQSRDCDLGLITFNAAELLRRAESWEQELCMDILAHDKLVALIHKRYVRSSDGVISRSEYDKHPKTMYNLLPTLDEEHIGKLDEYILQSNDADFHRVMLEENGAIVLMPALAQQYFFKSKQLAMMHTPVDVPLLHVAIYRKDAEKHIPTLVSLIHRKMERK